MSTIIQVGAQGEAGAWVSAAAGIGGALLGASIGGFISYWLQKREHDRADELRSLDRASAHKTAAHLLVAKLIVIASDLARLDQHLSEQSLANQRRLSWQTFLPLYVPEDELNWDRDELAMLFDLKLHDEFNLVGPLPALRNQAHAMMRS